MLNEDVKLWEVKSSISPFGKLRTVSNISLRRYCKISFYPPNTGTKTFYRGYSDNYSDAQYPKIHSD